MKLLSILVFLFLHFGSKTPLLAATVVDTRPPSVGVGGDVPKPGWVEISKEGATLWTVLSEAGVDLEIYKRSKPASACPLRIVVVDSGRQIELNPASDAKRIAITKLRPNMYIIVRDFRLILRDLNESQKLAGSFLLIGGILSPEPPQPAIILQIPTLKVDRQLFSTDFMGVDEV